MSTPGFILLSRDLLDKESLFGGSPHVLKLWVYLLLRANFGQKSYTYQGVEVKRGQFLRSARDIAKDCAYTERNERVEWSPSKVARMLQRLERDGRIVVIEHGIPNAGSLIEIVNWDRRQSGESFRKASPKVTQEKPEVGAPKPKGADHSAALWAVWLEELSPRGPHPSLTAKRARNLNALYRECLAKNGVDPITGFRGICQTLKRSTHHMSERNYQMPESFLSTPERRESWHFKSLAKDRNTTQDGGVGLNWSIDD